MRLIAFLFLTLTINLVYAEDISVKEAFVRSDGTFFNSSLAKGDFNNDGIEDIVIADHVGLQGVFGSGNLEGINQIDFSIDLNFTNSLADDFDPVSLAVLDYNNDGIDDLFIGIPTQNKVSILLGNKTSPWTTNMAASNLTAHITVPEPDVLFGYSIAIADLDNDNLPDLAVGAPAYSNGQGAAYIFYDIKSDLTYDSRLEGNANDSIGILLTVGNIFADTNSDLAVSGNSLYIMKGEKNVGNFSASTVSVASFAFDNSSIPTDIEIEKLSSTQADLFIGVAEKNTIYKFNSSTISGTLALSNANATVSSSNTTDLIGLSFDVHDVDQDGVNDVSIFTSSYTDSVSGNVTSSSGAISVVDGNEITDSTHDLANLKNHVLFYGDQFTLLGMGIVFGDFNKDEFKDLFGVGVGEYALISSGLNPYPTIDISVTPQQGLAPLATILNSTSSFGQVSWYSDQSLFLSGSSGSYTFPKGKHTVTAIATRNGFSTTSSPVTVVSSNNPPELTFDISEYTVNTEDQVTLTLTKNDKDYDSMTSSLTHNGSTVSLVASSSNVDTYTLKPSTRGIHIFKASLSDGTDTVTNSITLTVLNHPPIPLVDVSSSTIEEGSSFSGNVTYSDYESDTLTKTFPYESGQSFGSNISTADTYSFSANVNDPEDFAFHSSSVSVKPKSVFYNPPKVNTSLSSLIVNSGDVVTVNSTISDSDNLISELNYSLSINNNNIPVTLNGSSFSHNFDTTGLKGFIPVSVTVSDGHSLATSFQNISITNMMPDATLSVNNISTYNINDPVYISSVFSDADNDSLSTSIYVNDSLVTPTTSTTGNVIASTNVSSAGSYDVKSVTSDGFDSSTIIKRIHVIEPTPAPSFTISYSTNPAVINSQVNVIVSVSNSQYGSFTPSLTIDSSNATLTGVYPTFFTTYTPSSAGSVDIIAQGSFTNGPTGKTTKNLKVDSAYTGNALPEVNLSFSQNPVTVGLPVTVTLSSTDSNSPTYKLFQDNSEVALNNLTYTFTPSASGNIEFLSTISNSFGTGKFGNTLVVVDSATQIPDIDITLSKSNFTFNDTVSINVTVGSADITPVLKINGVTKSLSSVSSTSFSFDWTADTTGIVTIEATGTYNSYNLLASKSISVRPINVNNTPPTLDFVLSTPSLINGSNVIGTITSSDSDNDSLNDTLLINNSSVSISANAFSNVTPSKGIIPIVASTADSNSVYSVSSNIISHNNIPNVSLSIEDNSITVTETVAFTVSINDIDGDASTTSIALLKDGIAYSGSGLTKVSNTNYTFTPLTNEHGVYTVVLDVNDGEDTVQIKKTLEVTEIFKNAPPSILSFELDNQKIELGDSVSVAITTTDLDDSHASLTHTLTINGSTVQTSSISSGVSLNYTPTAIGEYTFEVTVSDGVNTTKSSKTLSVVKKNTAPVLQLSFSSSYFRVDRSITVTLQGSDIDTEDSLQYSLSMNDVSQILSGTDSAKTFTFTPTNYGDYTFKATLFDGALTTTASQTISVDFNYEPTITIESTSDIPAFDTEVTLTLKTDDKNEQELLSNTLFIDGSLVKSSTGNTLSYTFKPQQLGQHIVKGFTTDGNKHSSIDYTFYVVPFSTNKNPGSTGPTINPAAVGIISSLGTSTTVNEGNDVINRLAKTLENQDLAGAMQSFATTVIDGGENAFSDPESDIYVNTLKSSDADDIIQSSDPGFSITMREVPTDHSIVMGTIPLNYISGTPEGATGKVITLDMFSGAQKVEEGFSLNLEIENVFNADADQFLFVQDDDTGIFTNSGFEPTAQGNNLIFEMKHFSTYVLVNRDKLKSDIVTDFGDTNDDLFGDSNGTGASSGGGCVLKRRKRK